MRATALDQPYREQADRQDGAFDQMLLRAGGFVSRAVNPLRRQQLVRLARAVEAMGGSVSRLSDAALLDAAQTLRARCLQSGMCRQNVVHAFALAREASTRQIGLRHYRVQLIGGAAMLSRCIVEMQTGEGKTITAVLPAIAFALAGRPVHIVTVNDYLAERDAAQLRPVYEALGVTVGLVVSAQSADERREAYAADVTYCTNKNLVFDYLRDRLTLGRRRGGPRHLVENLAGAGHEPLLLRGLDVAIVDEADSVLIDEARTPLILAGNAEGTDSISASLYAEALDTARALRAPEHWQVDQRNRAATLTEDGRAEIGRLAAGRAGLWRARRAREELVERAISALHLFQRDTQYIVDDGKIQIVDEFTGRVMPDRSWEFGLHQMIEAKEGVAITSQKVTLARITFQRLFARYRHLTGMTGTAADVAGEFAGTYRVGVLPVPTHRTSQRRSQGAHLFAKQHDKWAAIVRCARTCHDRGRPVLIGTRSVETSEYLSRLLNEAGLPHAVLNARHDRREAEIVAASGQVGRITVATNMAGRGTDIRLSQGVREAGGLHVVLSEYHESKRIDRQLFGRGGRQGDPGSYESFASLDDEVFRRFAPGWLRRLAHRLARGADARVGAGLAVLLVRRSQHTASRLNARIRRETMAHDRRMASLLGFAGRAE